MATKFIQKGTELIKKAIEFDESCHYQQSLKHYSMGIQYLLTGLKYEKNKKVQKAIKSKVEKFLTRAEQIKNHLSNDTKKQLTNFNYFVDKCTKLVFGFCHNAEKLSIINIPTEIVHEIILFYYIDFVQNFIETPNVKWTDVGGLQSVKLRLKEYLILPFKFPQLFRGKRKPCCWVMLFGPSGVGKSHLIKAAITECIHIDYNSTDPVELVFFNISMTELLGLKETMNVCGVEKLIRKIYDFAREKQHAVILLKDLDCVNADTDFVRRCKTELLVQMQGIGKKDSYVQTIAMANKPWDLDPAFRRRFTKRWYVKMPDKNARCEIFKIQMRLILEDSAIKNTLDDVAYDILAQKTYGFTGYDIECIVRNGLKIKTQLELKDWLKIIQNAKLSVDAETLKNFSDWSWW